jgi:hypothetical protein
MSVAEVRLIAAALEEGEQTREVCPFCQGGSKGERSLNVTITDGLTLYNCHRASCEEGRGAIGTGNRVVRTTRKERVRKITPYEGELEYLDDEWVAYLRKTIGWHEGHLDIGRPFFAPEEHRVAFPIFSPMGMRRGWVLRSYQPFDKYKTLTRMDVDEPHLSWYRPNNSPHVVVVEDIPSAVRVAQYTDCVALCGSGCSLDYAMEIAAHYRNVVWALDADATAHALRLMRQHAMLFDTSRVIVLERDFKDEKEERLMEILYE